MSNSTYPTLDAYLDAVESKELSDLLRELITISLIVPEQILTFMIDEHDYSGIINVSGDEQLSLDIATHELFLQKMPNHLYSMLLGEETDESNILEGTGNFIIIGDFIDGSSIVRSRGPGAIVHIINKEGKTEAAFTVSFTLFLRFDLATEAGYIQFVHDGVMVKDFIHYMSVIADLNVSDETNRNIVFIHPTNRDLLDLFKLSIVRFASCSDKIEAIFLYKHYIGNPDSRFSIIHSGKGYGFYFPKEVECFFCRLIHVYLR